MGWRDRDWAKLDDGERRVLYERSGAISTRSSSGTAGRGLVLAVGVALAIYVVGHFPRGHPIVPVLAFHLPGIHTHGHIATTAASIGSTFTLTGTTPNRRDGTVVVEGSWNGGPWEPLGGAATAAGTYVVRFPIGEHGTLKIRAKYPGGGESDGDILVP